MTVVVALDRGIVVDDADVATGRLTGVVLVGVTIGDVSRGPQTAQIVAIPATKATTAAIVLNPVRSVKLLINDLPCSSDQAQHFFLAHPRCDVEARFARVVAGTSSCKYTPSKKH